MLTLQLIHNAGSTSGIVIPQGTVVEYLGHLPSGNIQVKYNNETHIINPHTAKELNPCSTPSQK